MLRLDDFIALRMHISRSLSTRLAIATVFFLNGFGFATWVSRIPAVRESLRLTDGQLGTALFALAAGALMAFPLAGRGAGFYGTRAVVILSGLVYCASLAAPPWMQSLALLMLSLFAIGVANGAMDVSMNALAVEVESTLGKPIMSSLHGMWSAGGLGGAIVGSAFAKQGVPATIHLGVIASILVVTLLIAKRWLPTGASRRSTEPTPHFARPEAAMIGLGIIIFCSFLIEGAMADWSAVLLRDLHASEATAALGYAAFSVAMMLTRFAGDRIVARWSATALLRYTNSIAAVSLAVALWLQHIGLTLLAFALLGLGTATVAPLVFREAGRRSRIGAGHGVAAMATVGYGGFLVGPPFVGWLAQVTSLHVALALIVLLALCIAVMARHLRDGV